MTIKKIFKKNRIIRFFYYRSKAIIHKNIKRIKIKRAQYEFLKNGADIMKLLQNILENEYKFFFAFGTLIGIIRDKDFLARDMDIDINIYVNKWEDIDKLYRNLYRNGFDLKYRFLFENKEIFQDTYYYGRVRIDINYVWEILGKEKVYLYLDDNDIYEYSYKKVEEVKKISFKGIDVNVPINPEQYLCDIYGKDWRIPNPDYKYWDNPNAIKVDIKGQVVKY